jgi:20S proteasome subunit beta 5
VYYVDSEGACVTGTFFCVGSGANLAYSVIDHSEKELKDMDLEEAVELATWAIRHATYRDGYSGGYINVIHIDSTGIHHVKRVDSRTLNILDSV